MTAATCEWCGGPRPPSKGNKPRKYCSQRCNKHAWRERPGNRERERVAALTWKAAHRDETRARDAAYFATVKGACSRCDGPMTRALDGGICQACRSGNAEERARRIVTMWARGATLRDIAGELGTTVNCANVTVVHMRAKGYDLPYRRPHLASPAERHRTRADGTPSPSRAAASPTPCLGSSPHTFTAKRPAMPGGPHDHNGGNPS